LSVALIVSGCSGGPSLTPIPSSAMTTSPSMSAPPLASAGAVVPVTFAATDGVELNGRLFGSGTVGIVLAHGLLDTRQRSWDDFAPKIAERGFAALTFDFRSFDLADRGLLWKDVVGAVRYLRSRGISHVFLIGASLGAHWCLWAAALPGADVDGVVALSVGPSGFSPEFNLTRAVITQIHAPLLFLGGTRDDIVPPNEVQAVFDRANQPKAINLLETSAHGAALVVGVGQAQVQARQLIFDFIAANT
ncbi:MAG TPA: alpha/beta fold hydrolase, partial [Candidatus Limnocylindrales bacterium]|nr:alpha/beta fold hydrolase [Candidatus Limnocylindrales bacterium]